MRTPEVCHLDGRGLSPEPKHHAGAPILDFGLQSGEKEMLAVYIFVSATSKGPRHPRGHSLPLWEVQLHTFGFHFLLCEKIGLFLHVLHSQVLGFLYVLQRGTQS